MISRWQRYFRAHPRATDAVTAVVPVFVSFPGVTVSMDGAPAPLPFWPGFLITGIACAALVWARHRPRLTAAVTVGSACGLAALGYTLSPLLLAPAMVALCFMALRTSPQVAYAYTAAAIALVLCTALIASPAGEPRAMETIGTFAWLLLPVALGHASRLRLAYLQAAHARAEYAEKTKEEEAQHRVAGERMRIARDLHDVVAHHLALANAQAGTIAHLIDNNEAAKARTMASDLGGTIIAALEELGTTVGLLRQAGDSDSPLEPAPGLAQLSGLADSFGAAGLAVTVTAEGEPRPLPAGTDLTAYRIIQEALTNVTKHAAATEAQVRLAYTTGQLIVTVSNDGGEPPASALAGTPGSGYGLIGMRERAASAGGRLRAGHRTAGGFEIAAELPLHPRRPHEDHNP